LGVSSAAVVTWVLPRGDGQRENPERRVRWRPMKHPAADPPGIPTEGKRFGIPGAVVVGMRTSIARRGTATVREPLCPQSREKRSLCKHCRLNPVIPVAPDLVVTAVITADSESPCTLSGAHLIRAGADTGLAVYTGPQGSQPFGWVCDMCVNGLPFDPHYSPPAPLAPPVVSAVAAFGWTQSFTGRPR